MIQPLKLKIIQDKVLYIQWNDKTESNFSLHKMRTMCPCATCVTSRLNQNNSYIPLLLSNQVEVKNIEIVGNYAIKIDWKDGHNSGIYEYSSLHRFDADLDRFKLK